MVKVFCECGETLSPIKTCKCPPFIGHFYCRICQLDFHTGVGPTSCPKCQGSYVKWKNPGELRELFCSMCNKEFVTE